MASLGNIIIGRLGLGSLAIFTNGKVWLDTGLLPSQTCSPDRDLKLRIRNWVFRKVVMVRLTVRAVPPPPSHPTLLQSVFCNLLVGGWEVWPVKIIDTACRTLEQTLVNTEPKLRGMGTNKIKASEMLVAPQISEYFLKSLKFLKNLIFFETFQFFDIFEFFWNF